jgi:hypothetical protein
MAIQLSCTSRTDRWSLQPSQFGRGPVFPATIAAMNPLSYRGQWNTVSVKGSILIRIRFFALCLRNLSTLAPSRHLIAITNHNQIA